MSREADGCPVRWCDERLDHTGPHRGVEYDVHGIDAVTLRPSILQLWRQGESARVVVPVLVTDAAQVALTWQQAAALGSVLTHLADSQPQPS